MVECEYYYSELIDNSVNGFNRYMVECESEFGASQIASDFSVLIDTWWNVNENTIVQEIDLSLGFNRYMVECES